MRSFTGSAVVTGAGSGIGRSIARALAGRGLGVVVADVELAPAQAVADEIAAAGGRAIVNQVDVRDLAAMEAMADRAEAEFGPTSVLVNNAGVTLRPFRASWDTSYDDFRWMFDINWWGVVHGHMAFVDRMLAGSGDRQIVNTASTAAIHPFAGHSSYSASKAAVDAFTIAVRAELEVATDGFGASVLFPGPIKTRVTSSARLRPAAEADASTSVTPWSAYTDPARGSTLVETADVEGELPHRASSPAQVIDADAVGGIVLDGIDRNQPYILTHPPHEDRITARRDQLLAAGPR
ncbi:SDR family NAD(P)-dependent oxidoreductase [Agromyces aerolatus]|uniref:SDR family NAD(P)-dependent oxidoreductase n=1 Tax=Agromyces sp. LY-1074 TaxID=3074080 RepID=UPI00285C231E|nr:MULTISPECIES: SDR family NAD(P)-dependent oxidoreductase [unclassified Agromyces]MDR5699133.1 SDR family NAD(P)-dependent oxidoreductase [Agromyces sp. LY-1074]MDR5705088.1 SDR family NAD(P)-dependent oxidoreductase [Agromyces sp. LY-1358]